jgi:tRNA (guanine-N7-)-methyltransferase
MALRILQVGLNEPGRNFRKCKPPTQVLNAVGCHNCTMPEQSHRRIRSFVLRAGRMTEAQRRALELDWPIFGIDIDPEKAEQLTLNDIFGRTVNKVVEIGFGNGDNLVEYARQDPARDFVGIEVHRAGVGHALLQTKELDLRNLKVICHDAVEVLGHHLADSSLSEVLILFPDPWHKKRHHKRRLIQAPFVDLLARKIKTGGLLQLATDWEPYALQMREVVDASPYFSNRSEELGGNDGFVPRPAWRALTRFEKRGQRLGHGVWDLSFRRV